MLTFGGKHVLT